MKFLIDNALSPQFTEKLRKAGYDALHVQTVSLQSADDDTVLILRSEKIALSYLRILILEHCLL